MMRFRLVALFLSATSMECSPAGATDIDFQKQYEAAMTKIFVSQQYKAIPIFRLNPLRPGDVVQIDNETIFLSHSLCYPRLDPPRLNIQPMSQGQKISLLADLGAKGQILNQQVASLSSNVKATLDNYMLLTIEPLSESQAPDINTLQKFDSKPDCRIISDLLNETIGKYMIAYAVLYGQVRFELNANFQGQASVEAQSELPLAISKVFGISEANIKLSQAGASFYITRSPGDLPVALVPAEYNLEELARITYYMQGERGRDLENAVQEAISTEDPNVFTKAVNYIRDIFLKDKQDEYRQQWAERFLSGKTMVTLDQLREQSIKSVDFDKIGTYRAAQYLSGS